MSRLAFYDWKDWKTGSDRYMVKTVFIQFSRGQGRNLMFSNGHLLFIFISLVLIAAGTAACKRKNLAVRRLLLICLVIALTSELIKTLGNIQIVPIVKPVVENGKLIYRKTGAFTPFLEAEHYPFELCSYQIVFIFLALALKTREWRKRLYAVMYTTCIAGAGMGILFSSAAIGLTGIRDFVCSVQVWRAFLYHSMLVVLGLYIGMSKECDVRFRDVKYSFIAIIFLDAITFYINSMMATPYYSGDTLVGVGNAINYFSSYNNPLGIAMTNKSQWFAYLVIRFVLAVVLMILINLPLLRKENGKAV